jgi:hypothetical protein
VHVGRRILDPVQTIVGGCDVQVARCGVDRYLADVRDARDLGTSLKRGRVEAIDALVDLLAVRAGVIDTIGLGEAVGELVVGGENSRCLRRIATALAEAIDGAGVRVDGVERGSSYCPAGSRSACSRR